MGRLRIFRGVQRYPPFILRVLDLLGFLLVDFLESVGAAMQAASFFRDPCILKLQFFAFLVRAFWVRGEWVPREEICEGVIAKEL